MVATVILLATVFMADVTTPQEKVELPKRNFPEDVSGVYRVKNENYSATITLATENNVTYAVTASAFNKKGLLLENSEGVAIYESDRGRLTIMLGDGLKGKTVAVETLVLQIMDVHLQEKDFTLEGAIFPFAQSAGYEVWNRIGD